LKIRVSLTGCWIKPFIRYLPGKNMDPASWAGSIDLGTPAASLLRKLVAALPKARPFTITVFGSAPLQIMLDSSLTSADVDIFSDADDLKEIIDAAGLGQGSADFFIEVSSELNFRAGPRWKDRSRKVLLENCTIIFPHPLDILIAKLSRLDKKDIRAFEVVRARTGHPQEQELIAELQMAVDLFRPAFDEEQGYDLAENCRRLWPGIYGRQIDPRKEIIAPALARRKAGYGDPPPGYKQELRDALKE
jgi:hypothetical protein